MCPITNNGELLHGKVNEATPTLALDPPLVATIVAGVSGQAAQSVPLASLKLSMAVYGQKLDGRPSG